MKAAEELFRGHGSISGVDNISCLDYPEFKKALTEHDKEIMAKIDEMIKKWETYRAGWNSKKWVVGALTELKKELK